MLRSGSGEDAESVRQLAAELGVPFYTGRADVGSIAREKGWNVEEAARRLRYSFLTRTAREIGASHIVTAHTLDDQVETVLLQLLRGSASLRGIPPERGRIIRPLLGTPRTSLIAWLKEHGHEWRTDPSNFDTRLMRAWLRHEVIPLLESRAPDLKERLGTLAGLQRDQQDYLQSQAARFSGREGISTDELAGQHPAVQRQAIHRLLEEAGVPAGSERIERIRSRLTEKEPWRETATPEHTIRVAYGRLQITGPAGTPPPERPVRNAARLPAGVKREALELPGLVLRGRRPGDRMTLAGGTKTLARLLIDRKIPREERDRLSVLASGSTVIQAEGIGVAAGWEEGRAEAPADVTFMRRALELAANAGRSGELPVGALLVKDGTVVAEAGNRTEADGDPTAHAELLCLRAAAAALGDWRLDGATLYVTLEPCPMCFGALLQAHVTSVVYAAPNRREGALGGVADLNREAWKRRLQVRQGPFAREAAELLSSFFRDRRQGSS